MPLFEQLDVEFFEKDGQTYANVTAVAVNGAVVTVTFSPGSRRRAEVCATASTILATAAAELDVGVRNIESEVAKNDEVGGRLLSLQRH